MLFIMLPVEAAAIWSMLGGYLLLPSNMQVDLPLLPPIDKMSITALTTFLLCWMKGTQTRPGRPSVLIYLCCVGLVLSPILTSFQNSFELQTAAGSIPGFYPMDGMKLAGRQLIALLPLFVGMRFLSSDKGRALLLKSLPAALTIYSLPMLLELRISPQIHRLTYGYHPHEFQQQVRAGGYRPVVFTEHGLALALIVSLALIAALVLMRLRWRVFRMPPGAIAGYLGALLILCKSLGPFIYGVALAPVIMFTRPRVWVKIACALSLLVCAYPLLRWHGLAPVNILSAAASGVSVERSNSFKFRLHNEGQLLAKAQEKPLFGWGAWGRNRVYDRNTGRDLSVTDGQWVIQYGTFGWFGYLSLFGLLSTAMFGALRGVGERVTPESITLAGLTVCLAVYLIDLIPNANSMSLTLFLAGAIATTATARVTKGAGQRSASQRAGEPAPAT